MTTNLIGKLENWIIGKLIYRSIGELILTGKSGKWLTIFLTTVNPYQ